MEESATEWWRKLLGLYEFDLETSGLPNGRLSRRERADRVRLARELVEASRRVADAADAHRLDPTPMLRLAADIDKSLVDAEAGPTLPESDPAWWHGETVAAARVVADHADLRDSRPKPPPVLGVVSADPRRAEQDRILDTAFGRKALELLASTHGSAPDSWRQLTAFNNCGGVRWDPQLPTKESGPGYELARRTLSSMVKCGLIERAGPGKSKRGGYRITDEGLALLQSRTEQHHSRP